MTPMPEPLLDVRDLEVRFRRDDGVIHAVNRVSFQVHENETLAIVGESGSGKTVSALSCLRLVPEPPGKIAGGEVWFEGRDLLRISERELRRVRGNKISMIFQDASASLNPVLTVGRQISEAMELHLGLGRGRSNARSVDLLRKVGISDASRRVRNYPHQFSGGMRQRSMIAMALSCSPKLLIADEPTTALDVTIQAQILALIRRLKAEVGTALIWITHDMGVVAQLADRVAVMYAGRVVEEGPVDLIFQKPQHPYTIGLLRSINRPGGASKQRLESIEGSPPSLFAEPIGCSFYERCPYRTGPCLTERPPLLDAGNKQKVACWVRPNEFGSQR